MSGEDFTNKPPIYYKAIEMIRNPNVQRPWFDRLKNLFWLIVIVAPFVIGWIAGDAIRKETIETTKIRVDILEKDIIEVKQFIAAQRVTNATINEIKSDVKDIREYLMEKK